VLKENFTALSRKWAYRTNYEDSCFLGCDTVSFGR